MKYVRLLTVGSKKVQLIISYCLLPKIIKVLQSLCLLRENILGNASEYHCDKKKYISQDQADKKLRLN